MKVDILINKMSGGGAERVVSIISDYLVNKGHNIRIITFTGSDSYELNKAIERVKLHEHPLFHSVVFHGFFKLISFYKKKENRPDIISSHIDLLGYMTIPVAKLLGIKIIVSEHMNHSTRNDLSRKILWNLIYPFANAVTVLTEYDIDFFKSKGLNVILMPNPCSFETRSNTDTSVDTKKEIITIGDLNRYHHKGFDNLITIAEKVLTKNPEWTLKIVGGGDTGIAHLKNLANNTTVKDQIIFTGFRKDIKELLIDSEIYVLSSRFEGLPMTLLEAMSQGSCCIAFNCVSGPSDVITNELNGLLIEDQNLEAMANGLNRLINNPELRQKFKQNAPEALNKFSIENVGNKWISLFNEIVKND
ncbi:glycosyltransferase family 4 protein [Aurantibacter sp.]|uniref:glycosyltransferase family 4 protein n=1 Tax=Aurantibacter sp. TaxID=2807103 RepID=UPI0032640F13